MSRFVKVAKAAEIPLGGVKSFVAEGEIIAVCNAGGVFYAVRDECSHMDYPLSDGELEGETITCLYHGAKFCLKTGGALSLPAVEGIETFEVRVEGDDLYVLIEEY
ncbi:MAG: non-heme iron oxygenase ferredoxin subunit [Deltaproteobacteria bacterium]